MGPDMVDDDRGEILINLVIDKLSRKSYRQKP